ncbi:MAG: aspartate aminotransferase family protein [PS1 clade bacterium]
MSKVMQRSCLVKLPTISSGEGVYLIDKSGKRYLDACGGAAVSCLGHSNSRVKDAMHSQINKVAYAHTSFFTNDPQEELAEHLIANSVGDFSSVYFVSGGSEAVEASIKLARQYFVEVGLTEKKYIIAREQSYHGNTIGALSAGGNLWRRQMFDPILLSGNHISACYSYRGRLVEESEHEYGQRMANELEEKIIKLGQQNVAAFIAEPVVGATLGAVPAVEGYFKRIREICNEYNVLLILDEVMCGSGRTGTLHACEQDGVAADIQTMAKGLSAGYQPLGAVLIGNKIHQTICNGSGMFQHGHTYIGHATACAAGLAVQKEIQELDLLKNVALQGAALKDLLVEHAKEHPFIGDVRGRGLFIGVEIVQDKTNKSPFLSEQKIHSKIKSMAMESGLMVYPMGGTIDGKNGDHVLLAPPFIVNEGHIEKISTMLIDAISLATSYKK